MAGDPQNKIALPADVIYAEDGSAVLDLDRIEGAVKAMPEKELAALNSRLGLLNEVAYRIQKATLDRMTASKTFSIALGDGRYLKRLRPKGGWFKDAHKLREAQSAFAVDGKGQDPAVQAMVSETYTLTMTPELAAHLKLDWDALREHPAMSKVTKAGDVRKIQKAIKLGGPGAELADDAIHENDEGPYGLKIEGKE